MDRISGATEMFRRSETILGVVQSISLSNCHFLEGKYKDILISS